MMQEGKIIYLFDDGTSTTIDPKGSTPDEEELRRQAAENLQRRYDAAEEAREEGRASRTYTLDELAALLAYQEERKQPTQNAEGVHVGDLFCVSWGYEQTNINYFQVVKLLGKHSALVREIRRYSVQTLSMQGDCTPIRDSFREEYTYRVMFKADGNGPYCNAPKDACCCGTLRPCKDGDWHEWTSYY